MESVKKVLQELEVARRGSRSKDNDSWCPFSPCRRHQNLPRL